jgi:hypothetical protein
MLAAADVESGRADEMLLVNADSMSWASKEIVAVNI